MNTYGKKEAEILELNEQLKHLVKRLEQYQELKKAKE